MKYNLNDKMPRNARRVLDAMSAALFSYLSEKPFEEITVGELCERAGYPRATFYNYFDDKYDLLGFFWQVITKQVKFDEITRYSMREAIDVYFDRIFDLFTANESSIRAIVSHNGNDGYFVASCRIYLTAQLKIAVKAFTDSIRCPIPQDLLAEHYANTLLLVFGKSFLGERRLSREETKRALEYLTPML